MVAAGAAAKSLALASELVCQRCCGLLSDALVEAGAMRAPQCNALHSDRPLRQQGTSLLRPVPALIPPCCCWHCSSGMPKLDLGVQGAAQRRTAARRRSLVAHDRKGSPYQVSTWLAASLPGGQ